MRVDGDPKHWDLTECLKRQYQDKNPAVRKTLELLIGLRNKIEHRHLPELEASLYSECQASLLNLEELLVKSFGPKYAMTEQLAISLQFSTMLPSEKRKAAEALATGAKKSVKDYIEAFRGGLSATILNSIKYSFNVFLVPKVPNRAKAADAAVEFIKVDEASEEELSRLEKLNVLIKEKKIPIANLDLFKPSQVVEAVNSRSNYKMTLNSHADAWRFFDVRPATGAHNPQRCKPEFSVYDEAHRDYLNTQGWIEKCVEAFSDYDRFKEITGREPVQNV